MVKILEKLGERKKGAKFLIETLSISSLKRSHFFVSTRLLNRMPTEVIVEGVRRCSTQQGYNVSDMRISDEIRYVGRG